MLKHKTLPIIRKDLFKESKGLPSDRKNCLFRMWEV